MWHSSCRLFHRTHNGFINRRVQTDRCSGLWNRFRHGWRRTRPDRFRYHRRSGLNNQVNTLLRSWTRTSTLYQSVENVIFPVTLTGVMSAQARFRIPTELILKTALDSAPEINAFVIIAMNLGHISPKCTLPMQKFQDEVFTREKNNTDE